MAHRAHPLNLEILDVLKRHQIGPTHRKQFFALIHSGRIESEEFRTRLHSVTNYETALYEILELLSRSVRHLFEPTHFESLGVPDVAAISS